MEFFAVSILIFLFFILGSCIFILIFGPGINKILDGTGHHMDANNVYEFRDNPEYKKAKGDTK